jgi:CRISPR/Cas system-associated exonuclease Cas4 (RecB family)
MDYYKPKSIRSSDWNYGGGKWKLSRSKIDLFCQCPRCFYLDNKLGVGRPKGFPFNLNSAVDFLLKKEFDAHRIAKTSHPLMEKYGVDAIPFAHAEIDTWRENFVGIQYRHEKTGFLVTGAVDDVWVNPKGELIIVDYKATSKDEEVTLDAEWQDGYKRQMEIYQWLLRQKGFKVSNTGYFVYANGKRDRKAFDAKLEFDIKLIPYTGSDSWIEKTLGEVKKCLDGEIPKPDDLCDYCSYRQAVAKVSSQKEETDEKSKPAKIKKDSVQDKTLF